ncbi:hypothetical protein GCM10009662_82620 [Catellatospora coxensis]|uniref:Uncharacterized protein n=1 Tax=Catellatospora coxensis TaxID=310354 RepID=A0A8J3L260_9ACTN|nr:hypothetical protein Cco03nite_77750 [Catellatospora coxensis]
MINIWLDGKSTLGESVFGLSMLWWGRIGKLTAYVATLVVVLDLLGVGRVQSLRDRASRGHAKFVKWRSPDPEEQARRKKLHATPGYRKFERDFFLSTVLLGGLVAVILAPMPDGLRFFLIPAVAGLCVWNWRFHLTYVAAFVAFGVAILLAMPFLIALVLFLDLGRLITFLGKKLLGLDGTAHPLRVGALVIGSLGFFVDLLAT